MSPMRSSISFDSLCRSNVICRLKRIWGIGDENVTVVGCLVFYTYQHLSFDEADHRVPFPGGNADKVKAASFGLEGMYAGGGLLVEYHVAVGCKIIFSQIGGNNVYSRAVKGGMQILFLQKKSCL